MSHLESIKEKINQLQKTIPRCDCKNTKLRIMEFGKNSHFVFQCLDCGSQVGAFLKEDKLPNKGLLKEIPKFDRQLKPTWVKNRNKVINFIADLSCQKNFLLSAGDENFHYMEELLKSINNVKKTTDDGITLAILNNESEKIRKALNAATKKFEFFQHEEELKVWFLGNMKTCFDIRENVGGTHIATGKTVEIDFWVRPQKHLVDAGFDPHPFGIEVKFFPFSHDLTERVSRGFWQTISYTESQFKRMDNTPTSSKFCLLFSNFSFSDELATLNKEHSTEWHEWRGMVSLANHANVGTITISGNKNQHMGDWRIYFGSGMYFSSRIINGSRLNKLHNDHLIKKKRVGNFG